MTDIKNPEGYTDIVPYFALNNISSGEKPARVFRPLVYICSPYRGDVESNTKKTREFCRYALDRGQIPLAPHLMFPQFMADEDTEERELALFMDIVLMGKCQEIWVLAERISDGMQAEIDRANMRRQKIRYFNGRFEEVFPQ